MSVFLFLFWPGHMPMSMPAVMQTYPLSLIMPMPTCTAYDEAIVGFQQVLGAMLTTAPHLGLILVSQEVSLRESVPRNLVSMM